MAQLVINRPTCSRCGKQGKCNCGKAFFVVQKKGTKNNEPSLGVDAIKLAAILGVEIDPKTDPFGFTREVTAKLNAVMARLSGDSPPEAMEEPPPEDEEMEEEMPEEEMQVMQRPRRKVANTEDERWRQQVPEILGMLHQGAGEPRLDEDGYFGSRAAPRPVTNRERREEAEAIAAMSGGELRINSTDAFTESLTGGDEDMVPPRWDYRTGRIVR